MRCNRAFLIGGSWNLRIRDRSRLLVSNLQLEARRSSRGQVAADVRLKGNACSFAERPRCPVDPRQSHSRFRSRVKSEELAKVRSGELRLWKRRCTASCVSPFAAENN